MEMDRDLKTIVFYLSLYLFTEIIFGVNFSFGQNAELKHQIGLSSLPSDKEPISDTPVYHVSDKTFESTGYGPGDVLTDFTLYLANGQEFNLKTELKKGKPVLLISGSYTCPIFRETLEGLNTIASRFSENILVYIVYVVEPHPVSDPSPYGGKLWTTKENIHEGILYRQPKTFGERKKIIAEMKKELLIEPPILVDSPGNDWWLNFGQAPNNAYLILTDGKVHSKQGWFNPSTMTENIIHLISEPAASEIE